MTDAVKLDMGVGDAHTPSAGPIGPGGMQTPSGSSLVERRKKRAEARKARADGAKPGANKRGKSVRIRAELGAGGSLHVRHLRDFWDGEGVTLADEATHGDGPVWIQLAMSGAFAGHAAGPFELNTKVFGEIIANFKATKNRAIPIDYEHASEQDATSGSIPTSGSPAVGWVIDLKIDGDDLWGLVEWLEPAKSQIRAKQYKFISPAIRFGSKDRKSGKLVGARLTSAGLTNMPFLDGMEPLAAKDADGGEATQLAGKPVTMVPSPTDGGFEKPAHSTDEYMPQIKTAFGLHPLCLAQECMDHLDNLRDLCMSLGPEGNHQGVDLSTYTKPLRDLVGGTPGMTWGEVFDKVEALIEAAIAEHEAKFHPEAAVTAADRQPSTTLVVDITPAEATPGQKEDVTMADNEKTAAIALKDAQDKAAHAEGNLATLSEEKGKLEVQLKDALAIAGRVEAAESTVKAIAAKVALKDGETLPVAVARIADEVTALLADKAKRDEQDLNADVEIAFDTYKDERKLTDEHKVHMLSHAKADRAGFNAMYPPVKPSERHLLRAITPVSTLPGGETVKPGLKDAIAPSAQSFNATVRRLMSEKKLSLIDAQIEASELMNPKRG